jgi:predicted dehydrogenase/threonine dehydrogenase-like Zn-dependent dehydrogenase
MKQVIQNLRTGETEIIDIPIPVPQKGQALVQTAFSLVSAGTERMLVDFAEKSLLGKARARPDLVEQILDKARREGLLTTVEAAFNRLDQPLPLGYSSVGRIVELGERMEGFYNGQRVACAGGGYAVHAEYAAVPRNLLTPLPDGVEFESAAFTTLGAIALHGFRLADLQLGSYSAVIGLGLLGLLSAGISRAAGCRVVCFDLDPERVSFGKKLGFQAFIRGKAEDLTSGFTGGEGFDAVLICADTTSNDPVELAGKIARDRARIVAVGAVGTEIPRKLYYQKELSFINSRSYGPGRYDPSYEESGVDYPIGYIRWTEGRNMAAFVELLDSGRLDVRPFITHRFPVENAQDAYRLISAKTDEPYLGVLIQYPETSAEEIREDKTRVIRAPSCIKEETLDRHTGLDVVRLGVLGAGNFASAVTLPALKRISGVDLVGIVSASGLRARHAADKFGFKYNGSAAESIIEDPEINTIAVLTRHDLHHRQVIAALKAGKNVFCEKPLALTESQLQEIELLVYGNGTQQSPSSSQPPMLTVGFNRRFAPLAGKMKQILINRSEPAAITYRVNAGYLPRDHWTQDPEIGGGRIIGEACHFIDFLIFLIGDLPVSVFASALPDGGRYNQDNNILTYEFPDGSLGSVIYLANGDKSFPKERLEAFCAGQVLVLDDFRSLEIVHNGKRNVERSLLRQDKGHRTIWEAFVKSLTHGRPPPIPYADIFGSTRATFAAKQSLQSQQKVPIQQG